MILTINLINKIRVLHHDARDDEIIFFVFMMPPSVALVLSWWHYMPQT